MPRLLLVDNDPAVRDVLSRAFEEIGWTVSCAATSDEARSLARAQPVDLVVTDVMLPVINGFQLAEQIGEAQPHVPVIFMSGYPPSHLPDRAATSLRASILTKPFPFRALLLLATHVIMRQRPAAGVPVCGDSSPRSAAPR
jgi:DNA-binding response OmpR family regulator